LTAGARRSVQCCAIRSRGFNVITRSTASLTCSVSLELSLRRSHLKMPMFEPPLHTSLGVVPHDLHDDLPVFPEHIVYPGLQAAERFRANRSKAQQDGGPRTLARNMRDGIERGEPVLAQEFLDLLIGGTWLDITYP
jgi:hypothetical protein